MGKKEMEESEVDQIKDDLDEIMAAECTQDQREDKLMDMYDKYESNLDFVGCSAIEDKLQDNVPETIAKLIEAEIRVWVLTGDKQETAIEIGKSCRLIEPEFEQVILNTQERKNGKETTLEGQRSEIRSHMERELAAAKSKGFNLKGKIKKINLEQIN